MTKPARGDPDVTFTVEVVLAPGYLPCPRSAGLQRECSRWIEKVDGDDGGTHKNTSAVQTTWNCVPCSLIKAASTPRSQTAGLTYGCTPAQSAAASGKASSMLLLPRVLARLSLASVLPVGGFRKDPAAEPDSTCPRKQEQRVRSCL
ncbi:hypothetical protein EYF80_034189 [Liparis tanakae]|uniref:Uncharacterized protein n=1 Tax=Liparis tanakae TaxID=230148 RepID=A0A4Z2GS96_9TELE|nr:hypothetical protein EYF80_034189 [Liparis tanakae]